MIQAMQSCWDSGRLLLAVGVIGANGQKLKSDYDFLKSSP